MSHSTTYKFKVDMTCQACVNAIKKSLTKTYNNELISVDTDLETKEVAVVLQRNQPGDPYTYDQVYEALAKTGRTITKLN